LNFLYSYRFTIGGVDYADLDMARDEDIEDACGTMVSEIRPPRSRRPRFHDEYDCGDNWIHQLIVEERCLPKEGVKSPICVAGQRACPPADCGGPWGYAAFVETRSAPDHRRHEAMLEGVGGECDPERCDLEV